MGTQWRKSKSIGGFRFTAGKRGISTSFGSGPLRVSRGSDGKVRRTVRAPGTGIYDTKVISGGEKTGEAEVQPTPKKKRHPWLMLFLFASITFLVIVIFI